MAAELVYGGHTLKELAGLDDQQIRWIFFRERDKLGRLKRAPHKQQGRPRGKVAKHAGFGSMYKSLWVARGLSPAAAEERWLAYVERTPSLKKLLERQRRQRR